MIKDILVVLLLMWGWTCASVTEGRYRCMQDFIRLGNSCYYLSSEISSWQEAHFRCRDKGAQLAVLGSQYEDSTLRNYLERPEFAQLGRWIGGMWAANKWIWAAQGIEIDDERLFATTSTFTLQKDTDEWTCLYMDPNTRYLWNGENCFSLLHYVCESPLAKASKSVDDISSTPQLSSTSTSMTNSTIDDEFSTDRLPVSEESSSE